SFLGSGHRLEIYGDDGALILFNPTSDYFRGFELRIARRGDAALKLVPIEDTDEDRSSDSRVGPAGRLVQRFVDACESGSRPTPGVVGGYRGPWLIEAARPAHATRRWIDVAPPVGEGAPLSAQRYTG